MSTVLHPVGPEPEERYWVRRVAVLVAAIVAIGVVIALVTSAMSSGSAVQAEPAPPTSLPPTAPVTPSASPTPGDTASPTPSASSTPGAATPTASPEPSSSTTPSPGSSTKKTDEKKASTSKTSKKATEQPAYAMCDGDDVRPTLTGEKTIKAKHATTLALSLINGGKKTCKVAVDPDRVVLTVVSGSDRIWSTKDCPSAMPDRKRTLLPQHALSWEVRWSGQRSGKGCSTERPAPKKGYYWAIASVKGSDDVRFRLILT